MSRIVMFGLSRRRTLFLKFALLVGPIMLSEAGVVSAGQDQDNASTTASETTKSPGKSSWAIAFDNDILVPGSRDQDYTYGINLTFSGHQVDNQWASLHQPLDWINKQIGLDSQFATRIESSKIEYGLFGFTPEDIRQSEGATR
jgi:hypothetical protein